MRSKIIACEYFLPNYKVSTTDVEASLSQKSNEIFSSGTIEFVLGVKNRYWTNETEYSSTLAIGAIKKLQVTNASILQDIDLLIYASATQDCIEPATSCIVQQSIGFTCPTFDVQNACNSVVTAIDIANTYILSGKYKKILICSGETPSKSIQFTHTTKESFKQSFSSFGLGDCGIALILEAREGDGGFVYTSFATDGQKRQEATVLGGGSMFPQDVSKNYFIGNPVQLKDFFLTKGISMIEHGMTVLGRSKGDIKKVFIHQVARESFTLAIDNIGLPETTFINVYESYGNVASCSIPLQIGLTGLLDGEKYMLVGLGAGATFGCLFYQH